MSSHHLYPPVPGIMIHFMAPMRATPVGVLYIYAVVVPCAYRGTVEDGLHLPNTAEYTVCSRLSETPPCFRVKISATQQQQQSSSRQVRV